MVARHTDLLIPPAEMTEDRDEEWCVWRDDLGALQIVTMTVGKTVRSHQVMVTLNSGIQTEWVCKHAISAALWIAQRKWRADHVFVCQRGDPEIEGKVRWAKHLAGDDWQKPKWMWLDHQTCVLCWGFNLRQAGSRLFGQKQ